MTVRGEMADRAKTRARSLEQPRVKGLTIKVFVLFLVILLFLNFVNHSAMLMNDRQVIDTFTPISSTGILAVLVLFAFNWIIQRFKLSKRLKFSEPEMITLYCMVALAALVSTGGIVYVITDVFTVFTLPLINDSSAIRSQMANYKTTIGILESRLFMPTDMEFLKAYWIGLERSKLTSVPWGQLLPGLTLLFVLYGTMMFVGLCIANLVRKRWTEHEHMSYPLTYPMQALINPEVRGQDIRQGFWSSRLLWAGVLTSGLSTIYLIITKYWEVLPAFRISGSIPFMGWVNFHPLVFGVGYLIPLDTSFGIVFAQVLERIIERVAIRLGVYGIRGVHQNWYQALNGGYIALALAAIIPARNVLKEIWIKAIYGVGEEDSEEGMPYRVSLFGLFVGLVIIALFFIFILGFSWWLSIFFALLSVTIGILAYARIRSKTGIPSVWSRFGLTQELLDFLGNETRGGKISAHNSQITYSFTRIPGTSAICTTGAFTLEAYELADKVKANRRDITKALVIAIVLGYIIGMYFTMEYKFNIGTRRLAGWNQLSWEALSATSHVDMGKPAPVLGIAIVFWGIVTFFFSYMKMNFMWWPIDPAGFVAGTSLEFGGVFWFSIFLAWLIKAIILRYGGMQGWAKVVRPYFIGIILGYIVVTAIAAIFGLQSAGYLGITTFK